MDAPNTRDSWRMKDQEPEEKHQAKHEGCPAVEPVRCNAQPRYDKGDGGKVGPEPAGAWYTPWHQADDQAKNQVVIDAEHDGAKRNKVTPCNDEAIRNPLPLLKSESPLWRSSSQHQDRTAHSQCLKGARPNAYVPWTGGDSRNLQQQNTGEKQKCEQGGSQAQTDVGHNAHTGCKECDAGEIGEQGVTRNPWNDGQKRVGGVSTHQIQNTEGEDRNPEQPAALVDDWSHGRVLDSAWNDLSNECKTEFGRGQLQSIAATKGGSLQLAVATRAVKRCGGLWKYELTAQRNAR